MDALLAKVNGRIISDRVHSITETEIVLENSRERLPYKELVSTLAAPIFWNIYRGTVVSKPTLVCRPVTFVHSKTPPPHVDGKAWDLIYYVDPIVPFTRVNKDPTSGTYLYEFTGDLKSEEAKTICKNIEISHLFVDRCGFIITNPENTAPGNIRFLGRAAQWDSRLLIHDAIREANADRNFVSVWNNQKAFSANFFEFNVDDPRERQKLSRDFVLRITDEAHEFLDATHWKGEKFMEKRVEREKLLEEWIDVFKFWMGLGNIWGFSIDDFFTAYWKKSNEVEKKFTEKDFARAREELGIFKSQKHAKRSERQD